MVRDFRAGAKPDVIKAAHVVEEFAQARRSGRPSRQAIVESNRQKLRGTGPALAVQDVEGIAHVGEEIVARSEATVLVEAIVVSLE
jgi:hypothetical protein